MAPHERGMSEVLVDLTPATGGHGTRGIGSYVRGMARAIAADPGLAAMVVALAAAPVDGVRVLPAPGWLAVRPHDVGAVTGWLADTGALRRAGVSAFHAGDPFRPLRPAGAARVAVTVHDLIPLEAPDPEARRHRQLVYRGYLRSIRRADRVVAVSRTTAAAVSDSLGVDPARIDVVPPVIEAPGQVVREPPGEPTFLFVGVPEAHKQPGLAIAALAAYRARHGAGRLRLIGPLLRGHQASLRAEAERLGVAGAVTVEGRVPTAELERAWATATALLAVSRVEGFGLPPVEAALRGVPVVAVDTPIARETLGEAATFAPPDAGAVADAMERAVPPSHAVRAALAERHSPPAVAAALRGSYGRLLGA